MVGTRKILHNAGGHVLTPEQVREIKLHLANGAGVKKLAKKYHVTSQSIYNIKHGKAWANITVDNEAGTQ